MPKTLKLPLQIRFTDIDIFGHVSNSIYAEWFDTARFNFIKTVLPDLDPRGRSLVMVHIETDFRKQILLTDRVELETEIVKTGLRSVHMAQRVLDRENGTVYAESLGILSTYDAQTGNSFPMPDAWRGKLQEYTKN